MGTGSVVTQGQSQRVFWPVRRTLSAWAFQQAQDPEFDRGLRPKASLTFEGRVKSPFRVDKWVMRSYKSKIFGKREKLF